MSWIEEAQAVVTLDWWHEFVSRSTGLWLVEDGEWLNVPLMPLGAGSKQFCAHSSDGEDWELGCDRLYKMPPLLTHPATVGVLQQEVVRLGRERDCRVEFHSSPSFAEVRIIQLRDDPRLRALVHFNSLYLPTFGDGADGLVALRALCWLHGEVRS